MPTNQPEPPQFNADGTISHAWSMWAGLEFACYEGGKGHWSEKVALDEEWQITLGDNYETETK